MKQHKLMDEKRLIAALTNPLEQEKAFCELVDIYQERLYWHIRKLVYCHDAAHDVLQNTYVRIFRSIANFKSQSSLHTWMYRIAFNESMRYIDKNKRYQSGETVELMMQDRKADNYYQPNEAYARFNELVDQLPDKKKKVFQMKYFDELTFKDIAAVLGKSENTIKSTYYTVVKMLEKEITEAKNIF